MRTRYTLAVAMTLVVVVCCSLIVERSTACPMVAPDPEEIVAAADEELRVLDRESFEQVLQLLEGNPALALLTFVDTDHHLAAEVEYLLADLARYVRFEPNDYLVYRLLEWFSRQTDDRLTPLFDAALDHPSPDVRRRAVEWLSGNRREGVLRRLESMWRSERSSWAREDLALALFCQDPDKHLEHVLALAESDSEPVAVAALTALRGHPSAEALECIIRLADAASGRLASAAAFALAGRPDSNAAAEALARLADSDDRTVRVEAIWALAGFETATARDALIRIATRDADRWAAGIALESLAHRFPHERQTILSRLLLDLDGEAAERAIETLGAPPSDPAGLAALFEIDLPPAECPGASIDRMPGRWGTLTVRAPVGRVSTRCWRAPGVVHQQPAERLPAGTQAPVWDRFKASHEVWYRLIDHRRDLDCWVAGQTLDSTEPAGDTAEGIVVVEFDAAIEDLASPAVELLADSGHLEIFDEIDGRVAVAVSAGIHDREAVAVLAHAYEVAGPKLRQRLGVSLLAIHEARPDWELF